MVPALQESQAGLGGGGGGGGERITIMSMQRGVETAFCSTPPSYHHQAGTEQGRDLADPALQQLTICRPPNSLDAGQSTLGPKGRVKTKCIGGVQRG